MLWAGWTGKKTTTGDWARFAREPGTSIQKHRLEADLNQEQVAYGAGLSCYTFQKFEKGESMPGTPATPSLRNVMAIAQVLGVRLDDLVPAKWPDLRGGRPEGREA